jgi:predicted MPP superfamily phosphohydrolase
MLFAAAASLAVSAALAGTLALYAYLVEPVWLKVREVPVTVSTERGDTLRVAHISDLHWGNFVSHEYLKRSFRTVAAQKPDLILLTGDYVNKKLDIPEERADYENALRDLSRAAPTFAAPGNHDGGTWAKRIGGYETTDTVRRVLESAGIKWLENAYECLDVKRSRVCVGGVGDPWSQASKPGLFVGEFNAESADLKILLIHNPDIKETVMYDDWDLLLAGHTHGGQVNIPFYGTPWIQVRDKRMVKGLYEYAGRSLHINPGVGSSQRRARLNCRPEVSMLEVSL